MEKVQSAYRLHWVELRECRFRKDDDFYSVLKAQSSEDEETTSEDGTHDGDRKDGLDIETYYQKEDKFLWVGIKAFLTVTEKEKELLHVFVEMRGLFEAVGEPEMGTDTFGQVNGPAILFPFVREQMANMTLKANIPPILLPPINFVKHASDKRTRGYPQVP